MVTPLRPHLLSGTDHLLAISMVWVILPPSGTLTGHIKWLSKMSEEKPNYQSKGMANKKVVCSWGKWTKKVH